MAQVKDDDWVSFKKFAPLVADVMTERKLRYVLMHRKTNGAEVFTRLLGNRLALSPSRFFRWVDRGGK